MVNNGQTNLLESDTLNAKYILGERNNNEIIEYMYINVRDVLDFRERVAEVVLYRFCIRYFLRARKNNN